eukprot:m.331728 g.331728  ORF g.331728 m.331728 type:complete len:1565 (+) comp16789_c0_seq1:290-4984(+)
MRPIMRAPSAATSEDIDASDEEPVTMDAIPDPSLLVRLGKAPALPSTEPDEGRIEVTLTPQKSSPPKPALKSTPKPKPKLKRKKDMVANNDGAPMLWDSVAATSQVTEDQRVKIRDVVPEAPVFRPTMMEFIDPLAYIETIRPQAEKSGICRIIPPSSWVQMQAFNTNLDTFRFTPRIQALCQLEGKSRVKQNFMHELIKFWDLQGTTMRRLPTVNRKAVDLFLLRKLVLGKGGYDQVCESRQWHNIALEMGFEGHQYSLRKNYYKLVYPYDLFLDAQKKNESPIKNKSSEQSKEIEAEAEESPRKRHRRCLKTTDSSKLGTSVRSPEKPFQTVRVSSNSNLCHEAVDVSIIDEVDAREQPTRAEVISSEEQEKPFSPSDYFCEVCGSGNDEDQLLLCDECDQGFHLYCLTPPLTKIPKGDWRCPLCLVETCKKDSDMFGFVESNQEFSLKEFAAMANRFKSRYFSERKLRETLEEQENEFWRIVTVGVDNGEDVKVFYGADLQTPTHPSGFATKPPAPPEQYQSPWNLNNLPVLSQSLLSYVHGDVTGMKVPWVYVGMCLSSFCWHNEDQWTYSINYNHWGSPKTWYGIPGPSAEIFEKAMHDAVPELFESQPDLLQKLVTMMSPVDLIRAGVPVVRTDQHQGQFVVTFPRAYHAGFNNGVNFCEAVNFALADWLPLNRECIDNYRQIKRAPVFSHEELLIELAQKIVDGSALFSATKVSTVIKEYKMMVTNEKRLRKKLFQIGLTDYMSAKLPSHGSHDVNRQGGRMSMSGGDDSSNEYGCDLCNTICHLSGVVCPCSPRKLRCLQCAPTACACDLRRSTLQEFISIQELEVLEQSLEINWEGFKYFHHRVRAILDHSAIKKEEGASLDSKPSLEDIKALIQEGEAKGWKDEPCVQSLQECIADANKLASEAKDILSMNRLSRKSLEEAASTRGKTHRQLVEDLITRMNGLRCTIQEMEQLKCLANDMDYLLQEALDLSKRTDASLADIQALFAKIEDSQLPLGEQVKHMMRGPIARATWFTEARKLQGMTTLQYKDIRGVISLGMDLTVPLSHQMLVVLNDLKNEIAEFEEWQRDASCIWRTKPDIGMLESASRKIGRIRSKETKQIKDTLAKAHEWIDAVNQISSFAYNRGEDGADVESHTSYEKLCELQEQAATLNVELPRPAVAKVKMLIGHCLKWEKQVESMFLKRNSKYHSANDPIEGGPNKLKQIKLWDIISARRIKSRAADARKRRVINRTIDKQPSLENMAGSYCHCNKVVKGFMVSCELCERWYHGRCVGFGQRHCDAGLRFLCPDCRLTRRPTEAAIRKAISSAQQLGITMPQERCLTALIEMTKQWEEQAKLYLQNENHNTDTLTHHVFLGEMVEMSKDEALLKKLIEKIHDIIANNDKKGKKSKKTVELYCTCRRPNTSEPMIQCDKCDEWFHFGCVGLVTGDVEDLGTYHCPSCSKIYGNPGDPKADHDSHKEAEELYCICRQPYNDELVMILCDECNDWFHLECLGLTDAEINESEEYYCPSCQEARNAKAKPNPANTFLTPVDLARRMGHTDVVSLLTDDLASTAT